MRTWILALAGILMISPALALGHAKLLKSDPKAGAVLKAAPKSVRLWFTLTGGEELHPQKSTVSVWSERGQRVDDGKGGIDLNDLDRRSMIVRLKLLPPGRYTVKWKAVSSDDLSVLQGSFRFTVARTAAAR